jgi:hypothetical protein
MRHHKHASGLISNPPFQAPSSHQSTLPFLFGTWSLGFVGDVDFGFLNFTLGAALLP